MPSPLYNHFIIITVSITVSIGLYPTLYSATHKYSYVVWEDDYVTLLSEETPIWVDNQTF